MGLFDFLKRNKNKPIDNNSNTMEDELPEDVLEKVDNYGSEGLKGALKNLEEQDKKQFKESIHDAKWRENSQPAARPGFVRYRFDDALRGGDVTKEYVKSSDMNNGNPEGELSEKELEEIKAGVHHFDEESDEQHKSR